MTAGGRVRALAIVVTLIVVTAGVPGAAIAGTDAITEDAIVVELSPDGSATVSLIETYDLGDADERDAFRSLEADERSKTDVADRFRARMRTAASAASDATDREMTVSDASISVRRTSDNETGVIRLAVNWTGMAAERDGELILTEPFATEFDPDRTLVVRAPDGYDIASVTPDATAQDDASASWDAGTSLDGFRVVSQSDAAVDGESPAMDGFGAVAALLALLLATALRARDEQ